MKAVVFYQHGGPEKLCHVDVPTPGVGRGDALVRVRACGVNFSLDLRVRANGAGWNLQLPHILGADVAGEIAELGPSVSGFSPGERVAVIPWIGCGECDYCKAGKQNSCLAIRIIGIHQPGGYAEYVKVPAQNLLRIPDHLSYDEAAAIPVVFTTAWHMLVTRARVRAGDTVLVLAAGGGVGVAATQIAKLRGARVLIAAGSDDKLRLVEKLGADASINYASGNLSGEVMRLTGGQGVDVVVETVGSATWPSSLAVLRREGRLVCCGSTSGGDVSLDLRSLYRRNLSFFFTNVGTYGDARAVMDLFSERKLKAIVHRAYPLREAALAHAALLERRHVGKIVLNP